MRKGVKIIYIIFFPQQHQSQRRKNKRTTMKVLCLPNAFGSIDVTNQLIINSNSQFKCRILERVHNIINHPKRNTLVVNISKIKKILKM